MSGLYWAIVSSKMSVVEEVDFYDYCLKNKCEAIVFIGCQFEGCDSDLLEWIQIFKEDIEETVNIKLDDYFDPFVYTYAKSRKIIVLRFKPKADEISGKLAMWRIQRGNMAKWLSDFIEF